MYTAKQIKRIYRMDNYYHALISNERGYIYHRKFKTEEQAREFINNIIKQERGYEYICNI